MKNILILYYSGVGNTRVIAERFYHILKRKFNADLLSVEEIEATFNYQNYDSMIIGYPVHHAHPPLRLLAFLREMTSLRSEMPAFIYNTRGLYSANSHRILAKLLLSKNIRVIMDKEYRCPASDVSLLAPYIRLVWTFEKNIKNRILKHSKQYADLLINENYDYYIPRFRLYSIINAPNKMAGQLLTFPIYLHKDKCKRCGRCTVVCPAGAQVIGPDQYPVFQKQQCEKCYRCIHQCPSHALSLKKRKAPKRVLTYSSDKRRS